MESNLPSVRSGLRVDATLACVPVRDLAAAERFFERLFGRPADEHPMPSLAQWRGPAGSFQVTVDVKRAGGGMVTIQVPDLVEAAELLSERGVALNVSHGTVVAAFASIEDVDGNLITLVQTRGWPPSET